MRRNWRALSREKRPLIAAIVGGVAIMLTLLFLMQANPPNAASGVQSLSVLKSETESNYTVSDSDGSILFSSGKALEAIQSAIDNSSSGAVIKLGSGDFDINGTIEMRSNRTLVGDQTTLTNGTISVRDASNVSLSSFSLMGGEGVEVNAATKNVSDVALHDITVESSSASAFVLNADGLELSKVSMSDCQAIEPQSSGFLFEGSGGASTISYVDLDSCFALNCGMNSTRDQLASGFKIADNLTLTHLNLTACESNGSWESGFYFSEASNISDAVLSRCIADSNGVNPEPEAGCGFYLDDRISLLNCSGEGNLPSLVNGTNRTVITPEGEIRLLSESSNESSASPVVLAETSIGYSLSSTSVPTGSNLHASGTLTRVSEAGAQPMAEAQVGVSIMLPDGTSDTPVQGSQATTDASGAFALDYVPSMAGTYQLNLNFARDEAHSASDATASFSAAVPSSQTSTSVPSPSTPAPPTSVSSFNYKVLPDGRVFDVNGAQVHSGEVTSSINWALSQGGVSVFLPAGTYNLANQANIDMRSGTTLYGEGDSTVLNFVTKSLIYLYNVDNVALEQFKIIGNGEVYIQITSGTHGNYLLQGVTSYQATLSCDAAFHVWLTGGSNVDGLRFIGCKAIEPKTHGFVVNGDKTGHWARNVLYQSCVASYCGSLGTNNEWACGFMLAENVNLDGLSVIGCVADYSYQSGFHIEVDCQINNAVFQSCSASYNGYSNPNPIYGYGFLVGGESQQPRISGLGTCTGTGNAAGLIFYGPGV